MAIRTVGGMHEGLCNSALPHTCDSLELRPKEFQKVIDDLNHLDDVIADLNHVIGTGKKELLGKLPPGVPSTDFNFLTDLIM